MWNRKTMKRDARADLKGNYLHCIIVSLVVVALLGSYDLVRSPTVTNTLSEVMTVTTNTGILDDFLANILGPNIAAADRFFTVNDASKGVLASFVNNATQSGSVIYGILNIVNKWAFNDSILPGILVSVGALAYFFYWFFVQNLLIVGRHRFFLENRCYHATRADRLFFVFRVRRVWNVALTMFLRTVVIVLWFFTIVGGFIMLYAYRMVPAILAENPDISPTNALKLSRRLMQGSKWAAFKLDVSFLGWNLLSLLTFSILTVLYITPYTLATNAELYMTLRAKLLAQHPEAAAVLNDNLLEIPFKQEQNNEYPFEAYTIPYHRGSLTANYQHDYSLLDFVMLFFSFALIGYLYEVVYFVIKDGVLLNRGTLHGPWLPLYGFGGVLSLLLLRRFAAKPVKVFFLSMALCGTLEYFTAWFLETFLHTKWWDYTGFFLNIHGRVCAEGLIVFGLACCLGIYVLSPSLANFFAKIPKKTRLGIVCTVGAVFLGDVSYSAFHPNVAGGDPLPASTPPETK